MSTSVFFPAPKDPGDADWYWIEFREALANVTAVVATVSAGPAAAGPGQWTTPGDAVTGTPLTVDSFQLGTSGTSGTSVAVHLSGGVSGVTYAITATVVTAAGATRHRSGILTVSGL